MKNNKVYATSNKPNSAVYSQNRKSVSFSQDRINTSTKQIAERGAKIEDRMVTDLQQPEKDPVSVTQFP